METQMELELARNRVATQTNGEKKATTMSLSHRVLILMSTLTWITEKELERGINKETFFLEKQHENILE